MTLEELLGEELYKQVQAKIDEANGKEEDKKKHIRFADLSEGEYISKAKYTALEEENNSNKQKLTETNTLIEELKNSNKSDENLQSKLTEYENTVNKLTTQLEETRLKNGIEKALLNAGANDLDYLSFKLQDKDLKLNDKGEIDGINEVVESLKNQYPNQFNSGKNPEFNGFKPVEKDQGDTQPSMTREELLKKPYMERVKLYNENPDGYNEIMNKE